MKEFERKDLEQVIKEQFNIPTITPLINSQISRFITERGYTYKQIAQALVFFVEIDKGTYDPKYGMGIVPFVMDRAQEFFERKRREREKQLESINNKTKEPDIILEPKELKAKKRIYKINIEELED